MEASRKRSRRRWLPDVQSPDDAVDVAHLIEDINAAHSARSGNAAASALIARLLLTRYSPAEIFACAERWMMSSEIREAIRYNGAVGVVDLADELDKKRSAKLREPETPEERAERFRRIDMETTTHIRERGCRNTEVSSPAGSAPTASRGRTC